MVAVAGRHWQHECGLVWRMRFSFNNTHKCFSVDKTFSKAHKMSLYVYAKPLYVCNETFTFYSYIINSIVFFIHSMHLKIQKMNSCVFLWYWLKITVVCDDSKEALKREFFYKETRKMRLEFWERKQNANHSIRNYTLQYQHQSVPHFNTLCISMTMTMEKQRRCSPNTIMEMILFLDIVFEAFILCQTLELAGTSTWKWRFFAIMRKYNNFIFRRTWNVRCSVWWLMYVWMYTLSGWSALVSHYKSIFVTELPQMMSILW